MMKRKEISFSPQGGKEGFFFESLCTKDWLSDHISWAPCRIEMKIKGILKSWFWISLHQCTLSILYSKIHGYMLSFMIEVDPCLLLPLCVLYEIQNHIFQQQIPYVSRITKFRYLDLFSRISMYVCVWFLFSQP